MSPDGVLMPMNLELEEGVLGACLLDSRCVIPLMAILDEGCFYKVEHKEIWKSVVRIVGQGIPLDMLVVVNDLRSVGKLEMVGGAYFVANLSNKVSSAANVEFHARILVQHKASREVIRIGGDLQVGGFDPGKDGIEMLGWAQNEIQGTRVGRSRCLARIPVGRCGQGGS